VAAIEEFLKKGNDKLTQNVVLDLLFLDYTADESDQYGVNWNVIKSELRSDGVLGLTTAFNTLLEDDLAPTILGYTRESGKYAGSQVLINALDRYGVVSNIKKRRVVSLNNQVSKLIKGDELGYLAQSGGTATANVGSQDNLIPGILRTGDTIYMLPNAVEDKVVIQLSTRLSTFQNLRDVTSGDRAIETPETTSTELFLKFAVRDGQTLLLSGTSDETEEYTENSTAGSVALGGELGGKKSKKETLMLITPRVVHL
jgi:type IVB pilus formation R64 PilN family outer membrane protein